MWFITPKLFFNKVDKEKCHNGHTERQMAFPLSLLSKQHRHLDFVYSHQARHLQRCQLCQFLYLILPLMPAVAPPPETKNSLTVSHACPSSTHSSIPLTVWPQLTLFAPCVTTEGWPNTIWAKAAETPNISMENLTLTLACPSYSLRSV